MVTPEQVPRIVLDAASLIREGEIVVFGSAALAYWLPDAPESRDVDLYILPEDRGSVVQALMGEVSWYHERHGTYVEVWAPETFAAPTQWRSRARALEAPETPGVRVLVPHPHDVLMSKLERYEATDRSHIRLIAETFPISMEEVESLAAEMPHRMGLIADPQRSAAFEHHLAQFMPDIE